MKHTVILTRDRSGNAAWRKEFKRRNIPTHAVNTFETVLRPSRTLTKTLRELAAFDWLVITSATTPELLARMPRWKTMRGRAPRSAAVGKETVRAARRAGLRVDFVPKTTTSNGLARELPDVAGKKILLLRAAIATDELPRALRARGARVKNIPLYETKLVSGKDARLAKLLKRDKNIRIVFGSPSAIRGFSRRIAASALKYAHAAPAIVIGPTTREAAVHAGFKHVYMAEPFTLQGILRTLRKLK